MSDGLPIRVGKFVIAKDNSSTLNTDWSKFILIPYYAERTGKIFRAANAVTALVFSPLVTPDA